VTGRSVAQLILIAIAAAGIGAVAATGYIGSSNICLPGEPALRCIRQSLAAIGPLVVGVLILLVLAWQIRVSGQIADMVDRRRKEELTKELARLEREIDDAASLIGRSLLALEKSSLRSAVTHIELLRGFVVDPRFETFASSNLRLELCRFVEMASAKTGDPDRLDLFRQQYEDQIQRLQRHVLGAALEARAGLEATYEGLIGEAIPSVARDRYRKWLRSRREDGLERKRATPKRLKRRDDIPEIHLAASRAKQAAGKGV
jgi:hypothetical protein